MRKLFPLFSLIALTSIMLSACGAPAATSTPPPATGGERLPAVLDRGKVICGVHGTFPGFGFVDSAGAWSGFDVDFCRAWAAALFNDANAVEFRSVSAQERFTALQSGEVDVLARNSTWTYTRDAELGLTFGPVTFYDGQAIMARTEIVSDPAAGLSALEGANVCVQSGTTTELNLADQFRAAGVNYTPVVFEDQNAAFQAYDEGRCDAITSDRSQLATQGQAVLQNFADHVILDVVMSKEPLGPAVAQGDEKWGDVVRWVVFGMIQAEELGITSENVDEFLTSEDPVIRRLLGGEGELGSKLGLSNDFVYRAIKLVGNYGEVFERNLSPFNMERGQNALWTDGGLMYAIPFR
ncbi:MAG TPA: amino acid ABC transporter substrate-binding protein [Anaerolineales bacterium]|nr:amino acid ABC transporter substrate-binding protein [Anaerolineales bacterium]